MKGALLPRSAWRATCWGGPSADCASMRSSSFGLSERFWSLARRLIPKPARVHPLGGGRPRVPDRRVLAARSEEHTSELQSRQYLVCRLLLEKKKKII